MGVPGRWCDGRDGRHGRATSEELRAAAAAAVACETAPALPHMPYGLVDGALMVRWTIRRPWKSNFGRLTKAAAAIECDIAPRSAPHAIQHTGKMIVVDMYTLGLGGRWPPHGK